MPGKLILDILKSSRIYCLMRDWTRHPSHGIIILEPVIYGKHPKRIYPQSGTSSLTLIGLAVRTSTNSITLLGLPFVNLCTSFILMLMQIGTYNTTSFSRLTLSISITRLQLVLRRIQLRDTECILVLTNSIVGT